MTEEKLIKIVNRGTNPVQAFGIKINKDSVMEVKESFYEAIKHIAGIEKYIDEKVVEDTTKDLQYKLKAAYAQIEALKAKRGEIGDNQTGVDGEVDREPEKEALIAKAKELGIQGNLPAFKTETLKAKIAEKEEA